MTRAGAQQRMGARDETKVAGGVGTCGRELCCATWLAAAPVPPCSC